MGEESFLRALARKAMKAGDLPDHRAERMWGGAGTGKLCAVCGKSVRPVDVEFELQFASKRGLGATNYHVHAGCFTAWEFELDSGGLNGHSLPSADNGGTIPDRERNTTNREERD
jgi:hypothetical protein